MVEKRYNTDWAKAKSRELMRDSISRTLLKTRNSSEIKVLCFPGIDAEEVFQTYDPLGIPRRNIVGLERDESIAYEIEQKSLGIQVVPKSIEEFVASQQSLDFDVISLDYTGPPNYGHIILAHQIAKKQKKYRFVFHSANLLRRDHQGLPIYAFGYAMSDPISENETLADFTENALENICLRTDEFLQKRKSGDISDEKSDGYTTSIRMGLLGREVDGLNMLLRFSAGRSYSNLIKDASRHLTEQLGFQVSIDENDPYGSSLNGLASHIRITFLDHLIQTGIQERCAQARITGDILPFTIWNMLTDASQTGKSFEPKDQARYSYISESGSPMIGDVYYLVHSGKIRMIAHDFAKLVGFPQRFDVNRSNILQLMDLVREYDRAVRTFYETDTISPERFFLGNSSKPVLTKQRAIEEFKSGLSVDEVKEKYRGWTKKPLAQWKAHFTMGTYSGQQLDSSEDNNLERITRDEALDLLFSGIPANEIHAAYPTSFSVGQLRAFKANITMGKYQKTAGQ